MDEREFIELVVEYPPPDICPYKEYKGKPYFSIKYMEDGQGYIGYGTYNPDVLSRYLKEYFIRPMQPEIVRCRDCYHYPSKYADCPMIGWARNENDFCSKAERKDDDRPD